MVQRNAIYFCGIQIIRIETGKRINDFNGRKKRLPAVHLLDCKIKRNTNEHSKKIEKKRTTVQKATNSLILCALISLIWMAKDCIFSFIFCPYKWFDCLKKTFSRKQTRKSPANCYWQRFYHSHTSEQFETKQVVTWSCKRTCNCDFGIHSSACVLNAEKKSKIQPANWVRCAVVYEIFCHYFA